MTEVEEVEIGSNDLGFHAMCRFQPLWDGRFYVVFTHIDKEGKEILFTTNMYGREIPIEGCIASSKEEILNGVKETEDKLRQGHELDPKGYKGLLGGSKQDKKTIPDEVS